MDSELGTAKIVNVVLRAPDAGRLRCRDLLNWVAARGAASRRSSFIEVHRLVAASSSAMGIDEHATVNVRIVWAPATRAGALSSPGAHNVRPMDSISRHDDRRVRRGDQRRPGRRRPGHARQHRHQGHGAQGPAPLPRQGARRLRRRDGRRLHPVRALRGQAREAPGQPRRARRSSWPRTGAPTACCAGSRRCSSSPIATTSLIITGTGDVARARVRHRRDRLRAAPTRWPRRARCSSTPSWRPSEIVKRSLEIAGDLCIYTNQHHHDRRAGLMDRDQSMHDAAGDRRRARPLHRRPGRRQARGRDRAAQPLAPPAGRRADCATRSRRRTSS